MSRPNHWYPNEIYLFLLNTAREHSLSYEEVAFMLLREGLASIGFICNHSRIGYAKKDKKPYCQDCYCRLEKVEEARIFKGKILKETEWRPLETFVDIKRKEDSKKFEVENEAKIKDEVEVRFKALVDDAIEKAKDNDTLEDRDGDRQVC